MSFEIIMNALRVNGPMWFGWDKERKARYFQLIDLGCKHLAVTKSQDDFERLRDFVGEDLKDFCPRELYLSHIMRAEEIFERLAL